MKQLLVLAALLTTGLTAKADIITCQFTEPFYTITYTTGTRVLKVESPEIKQTIQKVGFLIKGPGKFDLLQGTKVIMSLDLNGNGSDGMSDFVYPYEAKVVAMKNGANNGIGGCESLALKTGGN